VSLKRIPLLPEKSKMYYKYAQIGNKINLWDFPELTMIMACGFKAN
jgi:hypothetical protein